MITCCGSMDLTMWKCQDPGWRGMSKEQGYEVEKDQSIKDMQFQMKLMLLSLVMHL